MGLLTLTIALAVWFTIIAAFSAIHPLFGIIVIVGLVFGMIE